MDSIEKRRTPLLPIILHLAYLDRANSPGEEDLMTQGRRPVNSPGEKNL
jgi:hypothetical protein